jgi:hypothetical protein
LSGEKQLEQEACMATKAKRGCFSSSSKTLLERLSARRERMAEHIRDLIEREQYKEADGWEFRWKELLHIMAIVRLKQARDRLTTNAKNHEETRLTLAR